MQNQRRLLQRLSLVIRASGSLLLAAIASVAASQEVTPVVKPEEVTPGKLKSLAALASSAQGERQLGLKYRLATLYYSIKDYDNSNRLFRDLAKKLQPKSPNYPTSLLLLAQGLAAQERHEEAIAALKPLTESSQAGEYQSIALQQIIQRSDSLGLKRLPESLEKALLAAEPTDASISQFRAAAEALSKASVEEAALLCSRWLKRHKASGYAPLIALDQLRLEAKTRGDESAITSGQFQEAIQSYPAESSSGIHLRFEHCVALIKEGKNQEARAAAESLIAMGSKAPQDAFSEPGLLLSAEKIIIMALFDERKTEQALKRAKDLIEKHPKSPQADDLREWIRVNKLDENPWRWGLNTALYVFGAAAAAGVFLFLKRQRGVR